VPFSSDLDRWASPDLFGFCSGQRGQQLLLSFTAFDAALQLFEIEPALSRTRLAVIGDLAPRFVDRR
jgi:hypothetical protein